MKKVDYEIMNYDVCYRNFGSYRWSIKCFNNEDEAINFIKEYRNKWSEYRMTKVLYAVIDF